MKINKVITILISISLISALFIGCNKEDNINNDKNNKSITISGSTSVGPLIEKECEAYKKLNPNVNIEVNQLGSSVGIKDAINGIVQIGMSSRDLKLEEKKSGLKEVEIAYDGIALVTNKENTIKLLTIKQIRILI